MLLWSYDVTNKKLPTAYSLMLTALATLNLCHFELKSYAVMELQCYKEKTAYRLMLTAYSLKHLCLFAPLS